MTVKEQIKELIGQGKTDDAIRLLTEYGKSKGGRVEQKALLLSGQFRQWKSQRMSGIENSGNDLRRIEYNILEVLEFENTPIVARSAYAAAPAAEKKSNMPLIIGALVGLIAAAAAFFFFTEPAEDTYVEEGYTQDEPYNNNSDNAGVYEGDSTNPTDNSQDSGVDIAPPASDDIDYNTIELAGKTWLAENLEIEAAGSVCFGDDPYNCESQGRLYTWSQAKKACTRLGSAWRLPTDADWKDLTRMYGGAYGDLDIDGTQAYQQLSQGGSTGFNAQKGGKRIYFPDQQAFYYYDFNGIGYYWADGAPADDPSKALMYTFRSNDNRLLRETIPNTDFISCRCVKD